MDLTGIPFTKVYRSMLTSSVWTTPHPRLHMVRCVWMTLMLLADRRGYVHSSVPGLAAAAIVTIEEAEEALELFRSPDKYSRTKEHEGRRLVDVKGGWLLLNYETHRKAALEELSRESKREWYHREKAKRTSSPATSETGEHSLVPSKLDADEIVPSVSSVLDPDQSLAGPEATPAPEVAGQRPVYRNLDGWVPTEGLYAEAVIAGLSREQVDARIAELRNKPIGGRDGVFDRADFVRRLLPKWRTWAQTDAAKAVHPPGSTNGVRLGPRGGQRFGPVLEPTGKHRAYAQKHGLPLDQFVRELTESGAVEELGARRALELLGSKMSAAVREQRQQPREGSDDQ